METRAQVFLSYAPEDEDGVEKLYGELASRGFKPWMRRRDLLPGEIWRSSIVSAIKASSFFVMCLSRHSVGQRGPLQKEVADALQIWQEMLDSDIYLIPVLLEECEVPDALHRFHCARLYEENGLTQLMRALEAGMRRRTEPIKPESAERIAFRFQAERYGLGYERLGVHCTIQPDGSAIIERDVLLEAFSELDTIDTFLMVTEKNSPPREPIEDRSLVSQTAGKTLAREVVLGKQGASLTRVRVIPSLRPRERLHFCFRQAAPAGAFAIGLTPAQMEARGSREDHFGWTINRPTGALHLTLRFPPSFMPIWHDREVSYAEALFGSTGLQIPQRTERERLRGPFLVETAPQQYELTLDVDYPMVGLVYRIKWQPPCYA
jgi:hypothetical protein